VNCYIIVGGGAGTDSNMCCVSRQCVAAMLLTRPRE
jgi:hypothetical protein